MPHSARKKSETGFYHVVVKGSGDQIIFENDADRIRFINEMAQSSKDHAVEIHVYCLMSNHAHFLVNDPARNISTFMKQINERYAMYYAYRTGRSGHVFQARYWSEPIACDAHFLSVLRYIHENPEAAGICRAKDYKWSSYQAYLLGSPFVRTDLALDLLNGPEGFEAFHERRASCVRPFPNSTLINHLTYDELVRVAENVIGRDTLIGLKKLKLVARSEAIAKLLSAGFTESQIMRLSGVGRWAVQCARNAS